MEKREQAILGQIFESFTQFEDIEAVHKQLVQSIGELVEADVIRLFDCHAGATYPALATVAPEHLTPQLESKFDALFWTEPLREQLFGLPNTVVSIPEHAGPLAWSESPLYRSLLNPLGIHDAALLFLRANLPNSGDAAPSRAPRWCVWLGHARRNGLTRRRLKVLENIAPQLFAGLNNLAAWHERWKRAQAIESMLNFTDDLLVCVSLNADVPRLIAATRAAQQALGLNPAAEHYNMRVQEFMELAAQTHPAALQPPSWRAPDGRTFRLTAMPAPAQGESRLRLIRLEAAGFPVPASDDLHAARVAGLSAREAAVFARMSRGLGNREIAAALGISIDTVRAHLRNIFAKLEVCSRVEAVNAVRNRSVEQVLSAKSDSTIDTHLAETNVSGESTRRLVGQSSLPEPASHGIGITAQAT